MTDERTIVSDRKADGVRDRKTLRDEFAMAALNGFISNQNSATPDETFAKWSYDIADAMLVEREKGQKDE